MPSQMFYCRFLFFRCIYRHLLNCIWYITLNWRLSELSVGRIIKKKFALRYKALFRCFLLLTEENLDLRRQASHCNCTWDLFNELTAQQRRSITNILDNCFWISILFYSLSLFWKDEIILMRLSFSLSVCVPFYQRWMPETLSMKLFS
jgi:hypothetical protein